MIFANKHYETLLQYHADSFYLNQKIDKASDEYINGLISKEKESALKCNQKIIKCKKKIIQRTNNINKVEINTAIKDILEVCILFLKEKSNDYARIGIDLLKASNYSDYLNINELNTYYDFWMGSHTFYFLSYNLENDKLLTKDEVYQICDGLSLNKSEIKQILDKKHYTSNIIKTYLEKEFLTKYYLFGRSSESNQQNTGITSLTNNFILSIDEKCLIDFKQNTGEEFKYYYGLRSKGRKYVGNHKTLLYSDVKPNEYNKDWSNLAKGDFFLCLKNDKEFISQFIEMTEEIEKWIVISYNDFISKFLRTEIKTNKIETTTENDSSVGSNLFKKNNMYNDKRIEAINQSLSRCVNKYILHLKDFEAESEALSYDGKEGMKKFNNKISDLEFEILSFTSGISEEEKEALAEQMKESRNPEKSVKERLSAKQKAIELLKKYGPRVIEIGGTITLTIILRSLGLSLADIGL